MTPTRRAPCHIMGVRRIQGCADVEGRTSQRPIVLAQNTRRTLVGPGARGPADRADVVWRPGTHPGKTNNGDRAKNPGSLTCRRAANQASAASL